MKKPISKYALAVWLVTLVVFATNAFESWSIYQNLHRGNLIVGSDSIFVVQTAVREFGGLVTQVAILFAFGALIEVVDRMRWEANGRR